MQKSIHKGGFVKTKTLKRKQDNLKKNRTSLHKYRDVEKYSYAFGLGEAQGCEKETLKLGGKGANLHGMINLGLPVPPGFTLSTSVCKYYYENNHTLPESLESELMKSMSLLEGKMNRKFGGKTCPLLVSVRSGAPVSMPGMLDTVLNLGLNDDTVEVLAHETQDDRFSYDSYRRFISMYGNVVFGIPFAEFESALFSLKKQRSLKEDTELSTLDLKKLVDLFMKIFLEYGKTFPQNPWEQLRTAILAVVDSWMNPRACTYRKLNNISEAIGTAVTIQSMVYGNRGEGCGTGVAFTRNPSSGERSFFGEFLMNAQGEDVVAGIRTPYPINEASKTQMNQTYKTLKDEMPQVYLELEKMQRILELHYRDMQDIEFTIENEKLYLLQTRSGKRTAFAAAKIAVDMVKEGLIPPEEAVNRLEPEQVEQLLHPSLDDKAEKKFLAKGLPASPGAASGKIVFDPDTAVEWKNRGEAVILVRKETSPEDIHGMASAEGILTARGGMTSHAAVVARGMGKSCVAGCADLHIDQVSKKLTLGSYQIQEGECITLDGGSGEVYLGKIPTVEVSLSEEFKQILEWARKTKRLKVRANADTPEDAQIARDLGAEGIGLCRTEHMFFAPERINAVRQMILAESKEERQKALDSILPMQRDDFKGIFSVMEGLPVTIRLLDPPLHEFIPKESKELKELALRLGIARLRASCKYLQCLCGFMPLRQQ